MNTKHFSPEILNEHRLEAVRLRLDGYTVVAAAERTGLSAPTVSAAWKAFREGGWEAVPVRPRGRKAGQAASLTVAAQALLETLLTEQPPTDEPAWSSRGLAGALAKQGHEVSPRAIDHWLAARDLKPEPMPLATLERKRSNPGRWYRQQVMPVLQQVNKARGEIWQGGVRITRSVGQFTDEPRRYQLYLHGKRGVLLTRCVDTAPLADDYLALFERLRVQAGGKSLALIFHGAYFEAAPEIGQWLREHPDFHLLTVPADSALHQTLTRLPQGKEKR